MLPLVTGQPTLKFYLNSKKLMLSDEKYDVLGPVDLGSEELGNR